jgi:hypothetical protein
MSIPGSDGHDVLATNPRFQTTLHALGLYGYPLLRLLLALSVVWVACGVSSYVTMSMM